MSIRGRRRRRPTPSARPGRLGALTERQARQLESSEAIAGVGTWHWDVVNDVITWSPELYRMFGEDPESFDATYQSYLDRLHPDDRTVVAQTVQQALELHESYQVRHRVLAPGGEVRHIHGAGGVTVGPQGRVTEMFGVARDVTDEVLLLEALQNSEQRHRQLFEQFPHPAWLLDAGTQRFLGVNQAAVDRYGYTREEFMRRFASDVVPDPQLAVLKRENPDGARQTHRTKSGESFEVEVRGYRVDSRDRRAHLVVITDVTERERALAQLRRNDRRYQVLIEEGWDVTALIRPDFTVGYVTQSVHRVLGYAQAELVGRSGMDLIHPEDLENARAALKRVAGEDPEAPVALDLRLQHRDGSWRWVEAAGRNLVDDPSIGAMVATFRDITDRRAIEDAVWESERRFRTFIDQSGEGVWSFQLREPVPIGLRAEEQIERFYRYARLDLCNDRMAAMYGLSAAADMIGMSLSDLLPLEAPGVREYLTAFVQSGYRLEDQETTERTKDGETKVFRNSLVGVVEQHALVRVWGTQRDITELKRLEDQLRQSQKLDAVGQLTGGIAHDFNNLLTVVLSNVELALPDAPENDEELHTSLTDIRAAASRGAALVRSLMSFSRQAAIKIAPLELKGLLQETWSMLRRLLPSEIALSRNIPDGLPAVMADAGSVQQILLNLATNARDAMEHGGKLSIEAVRVTISADDLEVYRLRGPGEYVRLSVEDTGTGMDAATMTRIFEPFFTTKPVGKGTGLGLSMVYGLMQQHHGSVTVYSEPGAGTVFHLCFPVATKAATAAAAAIPTPREHPGSGAVILLVEDEEALRRVATRALERYGYQVLSTESSQEALALFRARRGKIDLLLTDVSMPNHTGVDLYLAMVEAGNPPPALFMSGYGEEDLASRSLPGGARFLHKPWTIQELLAAIELALPGRRASP